MRILLSRLAAIAVVFAVIISAVSLQTQAFAQQSPPVSPVVIAHGVDTFDGSPMMWQVAQRESASTENAAPVEMVTGFIHASGGPLTIANSSTGGDYLREGAAMFHARGTSQIVSGGSSTIPYTEIAISSDELGGIYTSNPVQTPNGSHAVELVSTSLANSESYSYVPGSEFAYLLYVTEGSVTFVDDENTSYDRSAGQSITITGTVDITATSNATFLIASIGPEVTIPALESGDTGTLTVQQFDCASGVDPTADASSCTPVAEPWLVNIHPSGREDDAVDLNIPEDGVNENGKWTWTEMSEGTWYITPAASESDSFQVVVTGATAEDDHYNAEITAGEETVVSIYLVGERPTGNGWLDIARITCDSALPETVSLETPGCAFNLDASPEFLLARVNDETVTFNESNAILTDDGFYRVADVPAGVYNLVFNVPETGDLRIDGDVRPGGGMLRYTVYISPEGQTMVIYAESDVSYDPGTVATPQG